MQVEIIGEFDKTGEVEFQFAHESNAEKALLCSLEHARIRVFEPKDNSQKFAIRFLGRKTGSR